MSKFMIIFMVFIPFQVISLKMMSEADFEVLSKKATETICDDSLGRLLMSFQFLLSKEFAVALLVVAAAVETVGADLALRQTDRLDEVFDMSELQGGETQAAGNLLYHALIFR